VRQRLGEVVAILRRRPQVWPQLRATIRLASPGIPPPQPAVTTSSAPPLLAGPTPTLPMPRCRTIPIPALANGITYYYVLSAVNANGESANSSEVSATPNIPPPGVPTGLTATAANLQVALAWNAITGATSYNVKRATTTGGPYAKVGSSTVATYTETGLSNGTAYYYVVSGCECQW
jgi:hypothetical protein